MKKSIKIFLALLLTVFQVVAQIPDKPTPPRLVNDYVGVLKADEVTALERKLNKYNDSTSTEIAVVIVQSLNDDNVADYAQDLFEKWGIGKAGKNNGILLLVSIGDRKINLHTGYGAEATITDGFSSDVINNILKPAFKSNQYYQGIDQATTAVMQQMAGEFKGTKRNSKGWGGAGLIFIIIIGIIILASIFGRGGRGGGGGGGLLNALAAGIFLSNSGRGFGGGGGGGDFGGFGGFGGGSSGGGGASGSW